MLKIGCGVEVKFIDLDGGLTNGTTVGYREGINGGVYHIEVTGTKGNRSVSTTVPIEEDRIIFVNFKDNDDDSIGYFANWNIIKENYPNGTVLKGTILNKDTYDYFCRKAAITGGYYGVEGKVTLEKDTSPYGEYSFISRRIPGVRYGQRRYEQMTKQDAIKSSMIFMTPKQVLLNGPYTTVVWKDGSHTVVKLAKGEVFDPEKAILYAIVKHMCKDVKAEMDRYLNKFDEVSIYKPQSKKEFLKELDERDAAGDTCKEYDPDEEEDFFDDDEDEHQITMKEYLEGIKKPGEDGGDDKK